MAENHIFTIAAFLGIAGLLFGAAGFADKAVIGGGLDPVESKSCLSNSTQDNIQCTLDQASQISGLVNPSSSIQALQAALLIPLSVLIAYIVITKILIPAISALFPG